MSNFEIQDTSKINSNGAWCMRCSKKIDNKKNIYRVKYGGAVFHLSCFYTWLKDSIPRLEKRNSCLKEYYKKLSKYMPQILAETISNKKK